MSRNRTLLTVVMMTLGTAGVIIAIVGCNHHKHDDTGGADAGSSSNATTTTPAIRQLVFASPDDAMKALLEDLPARDPKEMLRLFGDEGDDLLNSGDDVADQAAVRRFLDAYNQKHHFDYSADGTTATLIVGDNDWPMPIPLVKDSTSGSWSFDTAAGKDEIINRRIGRNELDVIQVCKAICDAQQDYVHRDPDHDGIDEYASKLISDPGQKNGLYWPTAEGEPPSPLGELVAHATAEGYAADPAKRDQPHPYHGYFYRLLTSQGPHAPGGAADYMVNGHLIGGFAIVAWPADYGNSGIMTFICDYKGDVYQKDLGENTADAVKSIQSYDPDDSWKKAETDNSSAATQPSS